MFLIYFNLFNVYILSAIIIQNESYARSDKILFRYSLLPAVTVYDIHHVWRKGDGQVIIVFKAFCRGRHGTILINFRYFLVIF